MIRQEAILRSPLRILDRAIRGGLGRGRLGAVVAPPGGGKSALLVELGLDALLRGRAVLHVALRRPVEQVAARYEARFDALAAEVSLADPGRVREAIAHRRLIWSAPAEAFARRGLEEPLAAFEAHLGLAPATVLVDGFRWEDAAPAAAAKAQAARAGAELWVGARRPVHEEHAALVDVALRLVPEGARARVTLERPLAEPLPLHLEGSALRGPARDEGALPAPGECTVLLCGSPGAEERFGACAERWGLHEVNYSFDGRAGEARTRGLLPLGEEELRAGEVSEAYLRAHLRRALPATPELRRVLQLIWHQVTGAAEVFAVGTLRDDGAVHGGTGWAAELARHWNKPVHLFDEARGAWRRWDGSAWSAAAPPVITRARFAGAGTRAPSAAGAAAIEALFARSFGPAPEPAR